jgi:uncharacterized protein involved in exopolysaccharide biosynthesis
MSSNHNHPTAADAGTLIEARSVVPAAWSDVPSASLESGPPPGGASMSPTLVWHTWRRWWHICLPIGLVLSAIAASVVWFTFKPVYQAVAILQIGSPEKFVFDSGQGQGGQADIFVRTQLATITSSFVLDRVVTHDEIGQIGSIRNSLDPVSELSKGLKVESIDESELYTVSFTSENPADAQAVVNAVLTEYLGVYEDDESNAAR